MGRGPDKQPRRPGSGGKRAGAGRPLGAGSTLKQGEVKAVKTLRRDAPADLAPADRELLEAVRARQIAVMLGQVPAPLAHASLAAANRISDEIAGPLKQRVQHEGAVSVQVVDPYAADDAEADQ